MAHEKEHRHRRDHDERPRHSMAASTDVADLEDGSAHAASRKQRDDFVDERWGAGPVGSDVNGRIIGLSVKGGQTEIMIGLGAKQGVHVAMEGYIKHGDGMFADFQIHQVDERVSRAMVDATPDAIQHNGTQVVVNPASMPKPVAKQDQKARIIGVSIEGGKTKIMIGLGARHGATWGMKGRIAGARGETFEISEVHPGHSTAIVEATIDMINQGSHEVILNPAR
jgi:hypothetical protein